MKAADGLSGSFPGGVPPFSVVSYNRASAFHENTNRDANWRWLMTKCPPWSEQAEKIKKAMTGAWKKTRDQLGFKSPGMDLLRSKFSNYIMFDCLDEPGAGGNVKFNKAVSNTPRFCPPRFTPLSAKLARNPTCPCTYLPAAEASRYGGVLRMLKQLSFVPVLGLRFTQPMNRMMVSCRHRRTIAYCVAEHSYLWPGRCFSVFTGRPFQPLRRRRAVHHA